MNSLNVYCLHKCGSVLQNTILTQICKKISFNFYEVLLYNNIPRKNIPYICLYRHIGNIKNNSVIVLRHPLNRLISQYYSFGWTHDDSHKWIKDLKKRNDIRQKFLESRKKIQNLSLNDYVIQNLTDRIDEYNIALTSNALIIPYEYIITHPKEYLSLILSKINYLHMLDDIYHNIHKEFIFNNDFSLNIIEKKYTGHRRTLHKDGEYLEKLSKSTIDFAYSKIYTTIISYENLLKKYDIDLLK